MTSRRRGMRLSPALYNELEAAAAAHRRVALMRRGSEFVVIARRIITTPREALVALLPMTGEEMVFPLEEIDTFHILDR